MATKKQDVSKEVIAAVLVLAVLVSVVGTWLVLDELSGVQELEVQGGEAFGEVTLRLKSAPDPTQDEGYGKVNLALK